MMDDKATTLWQLFTQQPKLWKGWDHASTPIGFHNNESAVLFGHPNPGDGFIEKEGEGVTYYIANPKPVNFTANSAVDLNGVATATIMWHEGEEEAMVGLITHEAFHAYQRTTACPMGEISMVLKYPVNDPQVQALAEIEASLLFEAVERGGGKDIVKAAIDARAARQALLPMDVATFEDETELGEGLATYIEIKTAGPASDLWSSKLSLLQRINKNAWGADRLRFYYSGMAWALLCDQYVPDWQTGGWRTLAGIVAEAIGHSPDSLRRDYPIVAYQDILDRQQREGKEREEAIQQTLNRILPGTGIRVELHTLGTPVGGGWNPNTAVTFPGIGRFHPDILMYTFDTGVDLKIEENALEKESCRHIIFERSDLTIQLNGNPINYEEEFGILEISGSDCSVYMPKARVKFDRTVLKATEILQG